MLLTYDHANNNVSSVRVSGLGSNDSGFVKDEQLPAGMLGRDLRYNYRRSEQFKQFTLLCVHLLLVRRSLGDVVLIADAF